MASVSWKGLKERRKGTLTYEMYWDDSLNSVGGRLFFIIINILIHRDQNYSTQFRKSVYNQSTNKH